MYQEYSSLCIVIMAIMVCHFGNVYLILKMNTNNWNGDFKFQMPVNWTQGTYF